MKARAKRNVPASGADAGDWRRFLSKAPPLGDLIEMKRLNDHKSILRRRGDLPPLSATRPGFRRLFG